MIYFLVSWLRVMLFFVLVYALFRDFGPIGKFGPQLGGDLPDTHAL